MSKKPKGLERTYQVRLYPTPEQGRLLMAHSQEYMSTVNVLSAALDADVIPHDDTFSTKDFVAALPSCVKNQALRDAHSVFKRSLSPQELRRPDVTCAFSPLSIRCELAISIG
jgi:hypothetical protein